MEFETERHRMLATQFRKESKNCKTLIVNEEDPIVILYHDGFVERSLIVINACKGIININSGEGHAIYKFGNIIDNETLSEILNYNPSEWAEGCIVSRMGETGRGWIEEAACDWIDVNLPVTADKKYEKMIDDFVSGASTEDEWSYVLEQYEDKLQELGIEIDDISDIGDEIAEECIHHWVVFNLAIRDVRGNK